MYCDLIEMEGLAGNSGRVENNECAMSGLTHTRKMTSQ